MEILSTDCFIRILQLSLGSRLTLDAPMVSFARLTDLASDLKWELFSWLAVDMEIVSLVLPFWLLLFAIEESPPIGGVCMPSTLGSEAKIKLVEGVLPFFRFFL